MGLIIGEPIRKENSTDGLEKIMNSTLLQYSNKQIHNKHRIDTRSDYTYLLTYSMVQSPS